jgi:hypothetical protein
MNNQHNVTSVTIFLIFANGEDLFFMTFVQDPLCSKGNNASEDECP